MKRCNKFMAVVAVILAFALTFTSVSAFPKSDVRW